MAKPPPTIESLLASGGGVLTKRGQFWSYPDAPLDPSGTNLKIPLESVPDAVVQDALLKGDLVARVRDSRGHVVSVGRPAVEGDPPVRLFSLAHAGSVELGTEVPLNSRPTHDAGRHPLTEAQLALAAKPPAARAPGAAVPAAPVPIPAPTAVAAVKP